MPSAVTICNLALSLLGDSATVANIDPPEGSPQAEHCALFYKVALDSLLSHHPWSFVQKRAGLAVLQETYPGWAYAYARPSDAREIIAVSGEDFGESVEWSQATITDGQLVIVTDQEDAWCQYVPAVIDPIRFPPDFALALAYGLASMLAGPLLRGKDAMEVSKDMLKFAALYEARAAADDANQGPASYDFTSDLIAAR